MNEEHLYQLIHPNQQIMTSELCTAEYQLQCFENDGGNVGILQSLHQMDPTDVHMRRERTPYASLLGPIETI